MSFVVHGVRMETSLSLLKVLVWKESVIVHGVRMETSLSLLKV